MGKTAGKALTPKAAETRQAILSAALALFAERGYTDTTVPDIVERAGVGHGTFYEYFRSRRDILLALTKPANDYERRRPQLKSQSLHDRIRLEISWYLADHVEHRTLSKVWHDAVHVDAEVAAARRKERRRRVERVRRGIESAGLDQGIDAEVTAAALVSMLEEFTHRWFIEGDGPGTSAAHIVTASETIAEMWFRVLNLDEPTSPTTRRRPRSANSPG